MATQTRLSRPKFQAPRGQQSAFWPLDCCPARAKLDPLRLLKTKPATQRLHFWSEPLIVRKSAFLIGGLYYAGKNENGAIPAMWDQFVPRFGELCPDLSQKIVAYGASRRLPHIPPEEGFEYMAALEVASFADLPLDMVAWEIPAAIYAVLPANDVPDISRVFDYFYREWLPQSQVHKAAGGIHFELYPETYPQEGTIFVYVPALNK